jgi:hypothetical protein
MEARRRRVTDSGQVRTYVPIAMVPPSVSERFLSEDERIVIADGLRAGQSLRYSRPAAG